MDTQTSEKDCPCTITDQRADCTGDHARNLSEAARYMLNQGGEIEMPTRVRGPSRRRYSDDATIGATIGYIDPPLPSRSGTSRESTGNMNGFNNKQSADAVRTSHSSEDDDDFPLSLRDPRGRAYRVPGGNLVEDTKFRAINRNPLSKFESMRIGDKTLNEVSIGGFKIDMEMAAIKAQEVAHLPSAKLPVIFVDQNLNFYHHFFNGIYEVISYDDLMEIIRTEPSDSGKTDFVIQTVDDLLTAGYERSDSEAMNLIKRMLQSTFKPTTLRNRYSKEKAISLYVEANLWGFPYIESTMTCKEIDLRYWLQACYKEYETAWFNTFKSTRVPNFARKVQTRSSQSSQSSSRPSLRSIDEETDDSIANLIRDGMRDDDSTISRSRSSRPRHGRKRRTSSSNSMSLNEWFKT